MTGERHPDAAICFLPQTHISFVVDYFDIKVKNEMSQLGPQNIIFGCYDSPDFPNDPLCSLFTRGTDFDPYGITAITDRYINIASQESKGLDFTALVQQELGVGVLSPCSETPLTSSRIRLPCSLAVPRFPITATSGIRSS